MLAAGALVVFSGCNNNAADSSEETEKAEIENSSKIAPVSAADLGIAGQTDPNEVVVSVADAELTRGELNSRTDTYIRSRGMTQMPPAQLAQARQQTQEMLIDGFIAESLLLKEAEKKNITATDEDIEESMNELKGRLPAGMSFEMALQNQNMTMDDLRRRLTNDIKTRKLMDTRLESIAEASDDDILKFYDDNKEQFNRPQTVAARHILAKFAPEDDDAAKATKKADLEKLRKELCDGGDFAAAAEKHSDCPSKSRGGDLGSFPEGRMVPEFEEAAFSQKIDDIGPIVETKFGYHIIQVTERNEAGVQPLEEIKDQIAKFINDRNKRDAAMAYVEELKTDADIIRSTN